jgi:hypothetical protein
MSIWHDKRLIQRFIEGNIAQAVIGLCHTPTSLTC